MLAWDSGEGHETAQNSTMSPEHTAGSAAMRDREGWTCSRFALFLAAVLVLSFAPILVGGQSLYFRDFGIFGYPFAYYHKECFWRGEIPL